MAEFKGLTDHASRERRSNVSGSCERLKRGEADLLIPQGLLSKLLRRTGEGLLNLKDLLTLFPPSSRATFSGLVGRLKRGEAYLLISQWLLAKWLSRTGEVLLNLKDLLTAFLPRLKGLFEKRARFEAFFGYQIVPNFTIFDQKRAANGLEQGTKRGFFATDFIKTCQVPWLVSSCHWRCGWDRLYGPAFPEGKAGKSEEYGSYWSSARWGRRARSRAAGVA
ncbi:MAG: hypothetical protein ACLQOO_31700 [Terriglobia bacterium]